MQLFAYNAVYLLKYEQPLFFAEKDAAISLHIHIYWYQLALITVTKWHCRFESTVYARHCAMHSLPASPEVFRNVCAPVLLMLCHDICVVITIKPIV